MSPFRHVQRISFTIYGILTLVGAVLHIWWHWRLRSLREMDGLTPAQWGLVDTFNWSIVALCLMFAALSYLIVSSEAFGPLQARSLARLMTTFWSARLTLEIVNPVSVPLLPCHTSQVLLGLLLIGLGTLLLPELFDPDELPPTQP